MPFKLTWCVLRLLVCVILTSDTDNGFLAGHIGDVDEGVVERGEDAVELKSAGSVDDMVSSLFMLGNPSARRIDHVH